MSCVNAKPETVNAVGAVVTVGAASVEAAAGAAVPDLHVEAREPRPCREHARDVVEQVVPPHPRACRGREGRDAAPGRCSWRPPSGRLAASSASTCCCSPAERVAPVRRPAVVLRERDAAGEADCGDERCAAGEHRLRGQQRRARRRRRFCSGRRLTARISPPPPVRSRRPARPGRRAARRESSACTRDERIGEAHAHARQPLELGREAGDAARAAGEQDLRDRKRSGLALVELERGDELAREDLQLARTASRPARCGGRLVGGRGSPAGSSERLGSSCSASGVVRRSSRATAAASFDAAPFEDARELADGCRPRPRASSARARR